MSCYGRAGGIGTASRLVERGKRRYAVGALTLCNMGRMEDLRVDGRPVGRQVAERLAAQKAERRVREQGSIIVVLAPAAPLDSRQLRRLAVRGDRKSVVQGKSVIVQSALVGSRSLKKKKKKVL